MRRGPGYELLLTSAFVDDLRRLAAEARRDPGRVFLRQQALRLIDQLAAGIADGHHALGYEPGKGDLRDCVTAYLQKQSADYRLVFREIRAEGPRSLPRRELLAVRARYGVNSVYAHVCGRLGRRPRDRQPGLDRFGDRAPGDGGSEQARRAELDAKRAIAHAWAGQRPLASSRPLGVARPHESFAGECGAAARAGGGDRVAGAGELGWRACSW